MITETVVTEFLRNLSKALDEDCWGSIERLTVDDAAEIDPADGLGDLDAISFRRAVQKALTETLP